MTETDGAPRPQPLPVRRRRLGKRPVLPRRTNPADRVRGAERPVAGRRPPAGPTVPASCCSEGDLPSEQVRTQLLGWVGADKMLAVVHEATGTGTWHADADLALLTLDLDAGTADVAVVGRVDAGDTGSAFSYATDLLAVDIPTDEPAKPMVDERQVRRGTRTIRPPWTATDSPTSPGCPWAAVGLALGAALLVMILRRKRT